MRNNTTFLQQTALLNAGKFFVLALWIIARTSYAEVVSLDLSAALRQTLLHNEELARYSAREAQTEALKLQAGIRPVTQFRVEVENVLGSGEQSSFDTAETTLALSQTIELGDKRVKRVNSITATLDKQRAEYELSRLDILAETSRRYYEILTIQARQQLISQRITDEQKALKSIRNRAAAGAVGQAHVAKMDLRLTRSLAREQQLAEEHTLAKMRLSAMWQQQPNFERVSGSLYTLPAIPDAVDITAAVERTPAFMYQLSLQRLGDANLHLEMANAFSDVNIGVGVKHFNESGDHALVFSFSMPLTFKNPNRGRIAAASANAEQTHRNTEQSRKKLTLSLLSIQKQIHAYKQQSNFLQQHLLPKARALLDSTQTGYQQGLYGVLQWTDAQSELFLLQEQLIHTNRKILLQLLELERVTGQPMTNGGRGDIS